MIHTAKVYLESNSQSVKFRIHGVELDEFSFQVTSSSETELNSEIFKVLGSILLVSDEDDMSMGTICKTFFISNGSLTRAEFYGGAVDFLVEYQ